MVKFSLLSIAVTSITLSLLVLGNYFIFMDSNALEQVEYFHFKRYESFFYVHITMSCIAIFLGPFQFLSKIRHKYPYFHRWLGKTYLIGVFLGGVTGLMLSVLTPNGVIAGLGFGSLSLAWLFTASLAYLSIRKKDVVKHRQWMIYNFSLTFAAVTFRLYLILFATFGVDIEQFAYPLSAWICWFPNLWVARQMCIYHSGMGVKYF